MIFNKSSSNTSLYDQSYMDIKGWRKFGDIPPEDIQTIDQSLSGFFKPGSNILELGFGNGGVALWCQKNKVGWVGVEINSHLVDSARAMGLEAFSTIEDVAGSFDGVIAFDVIEHIAVDYVVSWLVLINGKMKVNGQLLLKFPNGDSPFGRLAQHSDPTHINAIGRFKLFHYAKLSGFFVESLRAPKIPLSHISVSRFFCRVTVIFLRYILAQLCRIIFFGGIFIPLDSNYFAVLRKIDATK